MSDKPIEVRELIYRKIEADHATRALLPHTTLTPHSIDTLSTAFGLHDGRNLRIRVGDGIVYRAALETDHGDKVEAIIHCRDDALTLPMEIAVNVGVELQQLDHEATCRYRQALWVFGEVDCTCPYQEYVNHVIMVNTEAELMGVIEMVQAAKGGQPAAQTLGSG